MTTVTVDRTHIKHRPPFHVESFKSGLVIGCDANGFNCVRFSDAPRAFGTTSTEIMEVAVAALNAAPVADVMTAEI